MSTAQARSTPPYTELITVGSVCVLGSYSAGGEWNGCGGNGNGVVLYVRKHCKSVQCEWVSSQCCTIINLKRMEVACVANHV